MPRGEFRIYVGAAPGVGTTFAMLEEGARRSGRGTDVVIAAVDTHGRSATAARIGDLECVGTDEVPTAAVERFGLRAAAVLARHPDVALVDDLAALDPTPDGDVARWCTVESLLDHGINVIATIDIARIASLADQVALVTGLHPGSVVPDEVLRSADQLQLVDQTAEALRRRLAHGNIFPFEAVDPKMAEVFRSDRLEVLREISLQWMATEVEERLDPAHGRSDHAVVVAMTGAPGGERLVAVAHDLAERSRARLVGVHVRSVDAVGSGSTGDLDAQRRMLASLGGTYTEIASGDVAAALLAASAAEGAGQLVVGASRRGRWTELTRGSVLADLLRQSAVDVHVVADAAGAAAPIARASAPRASVFSRRRLWWGWSLSVVGPCALMAFLRTIGSLTLSAELLLMLLAATAAAVVGGTGPALLAAVESFVLCNWFLIPPLHRLTISSSDDAVSLFAFLAVAVAVGGYVSASARRAAEAEVARSAGSTLAAMAAAVATMPEPLPTLMQRLRDIYGATDAALLVEGSSGWVTLATTGSPDISAEPGAEASDGGSAAVSGDPLAGYSPDRSSMTLRVGEQARLVLAGTAFRPVDADTTAAFLDQLAVALEQRRLRATESLVESLAAANELRSALLAAVSHDLRTPLSAVKAGVSSLRQPDVEWPEHIRDELLETIDVATDRLTSLITNLLDMSRLQANAVEMHAASCRIDEIVHRSILGLGPRSTIVDVDLDDGLPSVWCDAALLDHVISNLVDNAVKWTPAGSRVMIDGAVLDSSLHLRIIDRGCGIPVLQRNAVRQPFQRRGDTPSIGGTGLGLAVASGFAGLMGITLILDDTPGGGTTATLVIPLTGRDVTRRDGRASDA